MTRLILCLGIITCFPFPPAGAQETQIPKPGDRLRVTAPECSLRNHQAELRGVQGDSLLLRFGDEDQVCPVSAVDRLELFLGRRRWGRQATVGALIGGVTGAIGSAVLGQVRDWPIGLGAGGALGAAIGTGRRARKSMLIGAGIGAVAGAAGGAMACADDSEYGPGFCAFVFGGMFGAPIGTLGGSIIGLFLGEDRWEEVPLPGVQPYLSGFPDGRLGLGISVLLMR